jgi:hypothetical protein
VLQNITEGFSEFVLPDCKLSIVATRLRKIRDDVEDIQEKILEVPQITKDIKNLRRNINSLVHLGNE